MGWQTASVLNLVRLAASRVGMFWLQVTGSFIFGLISALVRLQSQQRVTCTKRYLQPCCAAGVTLCYHAVLQVSQKLDNR